MVKLNEALFGALIRAMEQGRIFHLHRFCVAICHLQNHRHHSDVTHDNLEANVKLGKLMLAHEEVLTESKLPCWNIDLTLVDCYLAVQDQSSGVGCNIIRGCNLSSACLHGSTLPRVVVSAFGDLRVVLAHRFIDHVIQQIPSTIKARITFGLPTEILSAFSQMPCL